MRKPPRHQSKAHRGTFAPRLNLARALALALVAGLGPGLAPATPAAAASPPPLLVIEEEDALLLDDMPTNTVAIPDTGIPDINASCYVCHVNYKTDPFVQWHAKTNIGCIRCHGPSPEHVADEANLTPPDIMYWPSKIDFNCYYCHPKHTAPVRDVLARRLERCPDKDPLRVVCTDCHGAHRMHIRSVIWDKRTGRLLSKGKPIVFRDPAAPLPKPAAPRDPDVPGWDGPPGRPDIEQDVQAPTRDPADAAEPGTSPPANANPRSRDPAAPR